MFDRQLHNSRSDRAELVFKAYDKHTYILFTRIHLMLDQPIFGWTGLRQLILLQSCFGWDVSENDGRWDYVCFSSVRRACYRNRYNDVFQDKSAGTQLLNIRSTYLDDPPAPARFRDFEDPIDKLCDLRFQIRSTSRLWRWNTPQCRISNSCDPCMFSGSGMYGNPKVE